MLITSFLMLNIKPYFNEPCLIGVYSSNYKLQNGSLPHVLVNVQLTACTDAFFKTCKLSFKT